jgi:dienelactone hydrolase
MRRVVGGMLVSALVVACATIEPNVDTIDLYTEIETEIEIEVEDIYGPASDWGPGRHAVEIRNDLDEDLVGVLFIPQGDGPFPLVTALHGSGGLFKIPDDPDNFDPATGTMERAWREWTQLLNDAGYVVFWPASFYSRGSFDWYDEPIEGMDVVDRIHVRTYDAVAAHRWACHHPLTDCSKSAQLGFSNGGSTLLLTHYQRLDTHKAFDSLRPLTDDEQPSLGIAYYPGCGFQGMIKLGTGDYRPRSSVVLLHGDEDRLLDSCLIRVEQAQGLGGAAEHIIYKGVGHSFDGNPHGTREDDARVHGRLETMRRLHETFWR